MAKNEFDPIDIAAIVLLPFAAGFVYGVFTFQINVFGGFDFSQALWTVGGASITPALLLTVGAVAWIVATNELDGSNYEQYEYALIVGALALPFLFVFVPALQDVATSHDIGRLFMWGGTAAGATIISYVE